jgi:hypothetical protein
LRSWLDGQRLERLRRAHFSRLGEAVYRGDTATAGGVRAELDKVERRLAEQRRVLEQELQETLRREQEAAVPSRRTAAAVQELASDSDRPAPPQDPVPAPGPLATLGEADSPRLPKPQGGAGRRPAPSSRRRSR